MSHKWKNWSGLVQCTPSEILYPESEEAIRQIVLRAAEQKKNIRIAGTGHSFSPLVKTNDILLSLDKLQGLVEVDRERCEATVWAGTKIKRLGELLFEKGLAMENMGDIDIQSIAGATATGTHGTGTAFGNISTQIIEITLVNGKGEIVTTSATQNPQWFKAAQVSLGTLGVITRVRLKLLPTYNLEINFTKAKFEDTLEKLEGYNADNRNFEFYNFPYSDTVQLRLTNLTQKPAQKDGFSRYFNDVIIENGFFWLISEFSKAIPSMSQRMSRLTAMGAVVTTKINHSHQIFATVRNVRFNEMEYNVPIENYKRVIREVVKMIDKKRYQVHFPIENRFVKADDIWLSPAFGRESAYIAIHMYKGMPFQPYFSDMEEIFKEYGGRPHWGKMHFRPSADLAALYPHWPDFLAVREELDPEGVFLTPYIRRLFG